MNAPSDEQLLDEYLAGRTDRFEALVKRYGPELFNFLVRFVGNAAAAEEVVQETFLQVYVAAKRFDRERRFKPWLFTIAANKARDLLRGRARRPEVPLDAQIGAGEESEGQRFADFLADPESGPLAGLEEDERRQLVKRTVDEMPPHLREVLVLAYYHRFAYKDIAEVLGIPLGTVKSRLHAAVNHFAREYQARAGERVGPAAGGK